MIKHQRIWLFCLIVSLISFNVLAGNEVSPERVIAKGDKLTIKILEQEDLNGAYVVSNEGTIEFPLIPQPLPSAGLTYKALADTIRQKLEADCFYQATVIVTPFKEGEISQSRPAIQGGVVYIYGMISSPGVVDLPKDEELTVSKVIILKGGFREFANKTKVKLIRKSVTTGKVQTIILNMVAIIEKGRLDQDVVVRDGDLIVIPEKFFNF